MSLFKRLSALSHLVRKHPWASLIICFISIGALGAGLKYLDEDAQRQKLLKPRDRSSLARFNPFLSPPSPTPTPQLSREYVYVGSRLLAVEDANTNAAPPADLAVWRPDNGSGYGYWYVLGGPGSTQTTQGWGLTGDIPVPGDYDGDGKTDFSVFRPSDSKWYVMYSSDNTTSDMQWGLSGDVAAPADYDGDGKTDRAIYRPDDPASGSATWYVYQSSNGYTVTLEYGLSADEPAAADYDGDGRADHAVWRASNETFYVTYSSNGSQASIAFDPSSNLTLGNADPVGSDYDGDGKADFALFDANASPYAKWYIRSSATGSMLSTVEWGLSGDTPVPNDYDGDGLCDIATWRNSNGHWYIRQSSLLGQSGELRSQQWGLSGDIPVPAYFRR